MGNLSSPTADATTTLKGKVKLANNLGGTADLPTVLGVQAGAVTPAGLTSGTGATWATSTWSPTWTNLTVGNGTQIARYIQTGKWIEGYLYLTLGTTSSVGTSPVFTLPVTASSNFIPGTGVVTFGQVIMTPGGSGFDGVLFMDTTGKGLPVVLNVSGTYATDNGFTATVPGTWASTNYIRITFRYEAA